MDPRSLVQLKSVVDKLLTSDDPVPVNTEFMDLTFSLLRNAVSTQDENLQKILEVTGVRFPVLFVQRLGSSRPKSERAASTDASFITTRKSSQRSSTSSTSSVPDQSSICGSPLKLDIIAELSIVEGDNMPLGPHKSPINSCGVSLSKARHVNSLFINMVDGRREMKLSEDSVLPTLVIVCDGKNIKSVVCTVVHLLTDEQNNYLGTKISEVSLKAAAMKSVCVKKPLDLPSSEVVCHARYNIIEGMSDISDGAQNCQLQLLLEWRKQRSSGMRLLHDPPSEARSMIRVMVESGNPRSTAFNVYQELQILKSIVTGVSTTEVQWLSSCDVALLKQVQDLVKQLSLGEHGVDFTGGEGSEDSDEHVMFVSLLLEERKDLDFTDHLWKVLQNCSSYADLIEVFQYIFKVLHKGDLQPFIHKHNTTSVAQFVKDSFVGKLRMPSLLGLTPLQYLAEIGVQKLRQDLAHIFLHKNLTTHQLLEYFIEAQSDLEESLERLERLQNILEVIIVLKQLIKLPQSALCDCTRQMLNHYQTHAFSKDHVFEFVAPTSTITGIIENRAPCEWRMVGSRMVRGTPERMMYLLSTAQPYDWVMMNSDPNKTGLEEEDEASYFLSVVSDSVSLYNLM